MLLFIAFRTGTEPPPRSVSIHLMLLFIRFRRNREKRKYSVSIHLMLLFIKLGIPIREYHTQFQYISCYSLSVWIIYFCNFHTCFNTSHVTLYHSWCIIYNMVMRFQYISCYSLSRARLQEVYHLDRFNTSHVTLYPSSQAFCSMSLSVSIHLMLLFIHGQGRKRRQRNMFQYISCYSLSEDGK